MQCIRFRALSLCTHDKLYIRHAVPAQGLEEQQKRLVWLASPVVPTAYLLALRYRVQGVVEDEHSEAADDLCLSLVQRSS